MQTLIFSGSPKKNGDTDVLVQELASHLKGDIKIISSRNNINPCNDCRHCWKNPGCTIDDEMQDIYPYIETCDNIVIASPIWFATLSGPILNMASRIQTLYCATYFRNQSVPIKEKKGVIIIVGATVGTEIIPTQNALTIMKFMNVHRPSVAKIYSLDTNIIPAREDKAALEKCREVADMLNSNYK